jgi:hypothetical protein
MLYFNELNHYKLLEVLKKRKRIWFLNIGETTFSHIMWGEFLNGLKETSLTHMYASEHLLPGGKSTAKNEAHWILQENKKKHNLWRDPSNRKIIGLCTHMWNKPPVPKEEDEEEL